jgi:DNA-binding HxlR family transcriptional regulator
MIRKPEPSNRTGRTCPILSFHQTVGGKYKLRLLYELLEGPRRYGELRRELVSASEGTPVTARVLSRELKELELRGLVNRKQFPVVPPKVEYSLTKLGKTLEPVIDAIATWGIKHS